jgi:seryl-tRNA synthetase
MDFETATKTSGARFVFLKDKLALLERAISNFMLDVHTKEFGYKEISPPLIVADNAMFGTGQLPRFEKEQFELKLGEKDSSTGSFCCRFKIH